MTRSDERKQIVDQFWRSQVTRTRINRRGTEEIREVQRDVDEEGRKTTRAKAMHRKDGYISSRGQPKLKLEEQEARPGGQGNELNGPTNQRNKEEVGVLMGRIEGSVHRSVEMLSLHGSRSIAAHDDASYGSRHDMPRAKG